MALTSAKEEGLCDPGVGRGDLMTPNREKRPHHTRERKREDKCHAPQAIGGLITTS